MKNDNSIILGIDHGFRNIKTRHFCFPAAISEISAIPDDMDGILEFDQKIYSIYGKQISSVEVHDKTQSDAFYLLTLPAIAKELACRKRKKAIIRLAAGLPQKWFDQQKDSFKNMLLQRKDLHFHFEGHSYSVTFANVNVYIQGIAAAMDKIGQPRYRDNLCLIVDIGGETVDVIPIVNGKVKQDACRIDTHATNWLFQDIAEHIEAKFFEPIPEEVILKVIKEYDRKNMSQNKYFEEVVHKLTEYGQYIYSRLREFKFNLDLVPVIFVGGGAQIIQKFADYDKTMTDFVTDISANAKGYERFEDILIKGRW
ncbi:MAG: ParM/StbA family protein [Clostridiaceae bacterium]|nr:ParM/StbA family protein [Clostridiaceae bacterium]